MRWRILRSGGPQYFITTDNPGFFFRAYGLKNPNSEFVVPLSSEVALHGGWQGTDALAFLVIRQSFVREMNRRLVSEATRFVFSSCQEDWIRTVSAKERHSLNRLDWR